MFKQFAMACMGLLITLPALGGVHYKTVTTVDQQKKQTTSAEAWVSGEKAKIVFNQSPSPITPAGNYLVTHDAGETLFLVDPKKETYSEWSMEAMFKSIGGLLEAAGPIVKLEFDSPDIDRLGEEPGEAMHGLETSHSRFRTNYRMSMKVVGMKRAWDISSEQDTWSTDELKDPALAVWLRGVPRSTGNEELDNLLEAEMSKVKGFPLKIVTANTMTNKKGKSKTTITTMRVTELEQVDLPDSTFPLPAALGYEKVEMLPLAGEEGGLGALFGSGKN